MLTAMRVHRVALLSTPLSSASRIGATLMLSALLLLIALLLAAGCGDTMVVAARVVRPAVLPVRAFPQVYVVSVDDADSAAVADRLADHLAERPGPANVRLSVRRLTHDRLAALRRDGSVARVSVVVVVEVSVSEDQRPDFSSRPNSVCGPGGCYLATRPYLNDIPTLRARAHFQVEDGPTGRMLQQATLETRDEGSEPLAMRARAVLDLAARAGGLVDAGARGVDVALVDVDSSDVRRALALLERGDWGAGARLLARIVAAEGFARRPPAQRAATLFDLGQARRFSGPDDANAVARLDAAVDAMRQAMRLEPRVLYAEGLRDVERQRRDLALSTEQREAAAHNFALSRSPPPPEVPDVPAAYRAAAPDAGPPPSTP